ncbi:hypothetical protein H5410_011687 [Solanum commersonii]|uniref:Uncharacterized protein n=1 Tax=Solanum commersonii TaxID=4109 RepID=A0A9J6APC2_SOLCO|nr:hypothetical protein H5410_011687 [Solanum commersonii]
MASLAILVMHSGRWDNDNCYVDYTIEGVIFKESSSYRELYNVIAMQLGVDTNLIKLKLEYRVKESKTPMLIHNDMGVRVSNITELCESSNQENDMVTSICNDGIADFETMHMSIGELVEPLGLGVVELRWSHFGSFYTFGMYFDECEWLMKASNIASPECLGSEHLIRSYFKLIGGIVKPKFVDHKRKYTPSDIRSDVKIYLGVDVNYSLAWRAKEKARFH